MNKKFDVFAALKDLGFEEVKSTTLPGTYLTKSYNRTDDYGYTTHFTVQIYFSQDMSTLVADYYDGHTQIKHKVHLNEKRAFNAIKQTAANHGFEL